MLKQIRSGEYEGIKDKIYKPEWKPDFGPQEFIEKKKIRSDSYGFEIFSDSIQCEYPGNKEQAHKIALNVREQGRSESSPAGLKP